MSATTWSGEGWRITVSEGEMTVTQASGVVLVSGADASRLVMRRRWRRWSLHNNGRRLVHLRGITRSNASTLNRAVRCLVLSPAIADAIRWRTAVARLLDAGLAEQRWIPTEALGALLATHPESRLLDRIRAASCESTLTDEQREAAAFLDANIEALVAGTNERIMAAELSSRRPFFDSIEKRPLTDEQAQAVVCFDNRVQVLAGAGSGKTSVMIARAAYAVSRGFVAPDRILMLAFNAQASTELQQRVSARFAAAGINSSGLRASTFHSFGLDVIGRATGQKPRLAPWLDQGRELKKVMEIVDELRDSSLSFRYGWDMFRTLIANTRAAGAANEPEKGGQKTVYRTLAGEIVKSHGERTIANFLFMSGVAYVYEKSYEFPVADAEHSQYRPDFYYPDIDVWHEHWALDRDGTPPAAFRGYAKEMAWKRRTHAKYGTTLVESTSAEVASGEGLTKLKEALSRLGLHFDWDPDRRPPAEQDQPVGHEDLARLVRTFTAHVKSNSLTPEDIDNRLAPDAGHPDSVRTRFFLPLYWQIHAEWERQLAADGSVDFDDMVVKAADHLEAGKGDFPYDLIMVDEFQDASRSRARLVRALVRPAGRFLLAVGDDWQAINRFAGADLSAMIDFESWFGPARQLALSTTFRCPQKICDVARTFVSKNPAQFDKPMRSATDDLGAPVKIIRAPDVRAALASYLADLSAAIAGGRMPSGPSAKASVDVLGRYNSDRKLVPERRPSNLSVNFRTVHSSKGLEADYIVVPMGAGRRGFPSAIADDPVLDVVMPAPESFAFAEERRLFYVALTRARREVTLITSSQRMSPFAIELLGDPNVIVIGDLDAPTEICAKCGQGTMVERTGQYGPFLRCSAYPACGHTRSLPKPRPAKRATGSRSTKRSGTRLDRETRRASQPRRPDSQGD